MFQSISNHLDERRAETEKDNEKSESSTYIWKERFQSQRNNLHFEYSTIIILNAQDVRNPPIILDFSLQANFDCDETRYSGQMDEAEKGEQTRKSNI